MTPELSFPNSPAHSLNSAGVPVSFSLCDGSVAVYKVVYYYTTQTVEVHKGNVVLLSTTLNPIGLAALNSIPFEFGGEKVFGIIGFFF